MTDPAAPNVLRSLDPLALAHVDARTALAPLGDLRPVGLDELAAVDDLQVRRDRKYLLPLAALDGFLAAIAEVADRGPTGPSVGGQSVGAEAADAGAGVLTIEGVRTFRYESVYFDTVDLASYLGAARRRPQRFKVRTRSYLDTVLCMLEVKTRDARSRTVKHRHPYDINLRSQLTSIGRQFVASIPHSAPTAERLHPMLTTAYRRATILLPGARVTIDIDLTWERPDGQATALGHLALIETKTPGPPCTIDRILWQAGHRPVGISKYATGLAALSPDLPANKWNRILRHHFHWQPARPA
jgi:hypothetical protein